MTLVGCYKKKSNHFERLGVPACYPLPHLPPPVSRLLYLVSRLPSLISLLLSLVSLLHYPPPLSTPLLLKHQ